MQLSARGRRLAVIGVVVTGAAASIATSAPHSDLEASVTLPGAELSQAHPVATYHLHAAVAGATGPAHGEVMIATSTSQLTPVPIVLSASSSADPQGESVQLETTNTATSVVINCDSLPCSDDVVVRIELRQRSDGAWPPPSGWTMYGFLQVDIDEHKTVLTAASATLELVP